MRITEAEYLKNFFNPIETAMIGIDLQNDFADPKGALYVKDGEKLADIANKWASEFGSKSIVCWTKDYHPKDHCSFKENGGSWPKHCVKKQWGSEFHRDLEILDDDFVIFKGYNSNIDSYSAFFDNDKKQETLLHVTLQDRKVYSLFVMGLATDYCVKFTVLDAIELGYKVFVYLPGCRAVNVNPDDGEKAVKEMEDAGAIIIEE